ncbi:MAG: DEAD/DEAH box helicase [Saprospiraceae bacterium]|nr:DEAD/DEAH box helicase [Saprospiraceae bacterium]
MSYNTNSIIKILKLLNIDKLNDMQQVMLKTAHKNNDVVLLAPTGSGKTLGFLLPLLQKLKKKEKPFIQALILTPSRELAIQITNVFQTMQTGFKVTCCYGGHPIKIELQTLINPPALLIGTPGRIADHLRRNSFSTEHIHTLILDEFDKSLEFGFAKEMSFIIYQLNNLNSRQLTSATSSIDIPEFVGITKSVKIDFINQKRTEKLEIKALVFSQEKKIETLLKLVSYCGKDPTLIFCNQRNTVEEISDILYRKGFIIDIFHGGLEQKEREIALIKFKNGSINILITTDLASRGLDISSIKNIIHYQLPHTETEFIHRNGRTARMNSDGTAYLILDEDRHWRSYITEDIEYIELPEEISLPKKPEWVTLYVSAGKKDKINKFDIVGSFFKKGQLKKDELGLVVVKDHASFVAVKENKVEGLIQCLNKQRIKKKKVIVEIAR